MIFKKFPFVYVICIPLLWFFFKLLPVFTHPCDFSTANFIYAENFNQVKIWCFDPTNTMRFDDSSNFLYVASLWVLIHFLKFTTIKAALAISAISMTVSIYLLHRLVGSRFWSVHLLLIALLFMSTQIWAGVLGDEIIFQGMLWLMAVHAFWRHRYLWLMVACTVNVMARPDNIFIILPMIIVSYLDIKKLKERDKNKFIFRRIRRTFFFLFLPVTAYFTYRYLYFGKILPFNWLHHSLETDKRYGFFNYEGFNFLKHYLRFYTLPLLIGVAFYFLKEFKTLSARYYALAFSFILIPVLYNCTFAQDENLGYKNQYAIYLGLVILSLIFIRDYRSVSQGLTTAIFVLFFGFKISFLYFQKTLQSGNDNGYYITNDLAQIHNGKAIVYYDNFIAWMTEWQVTFASGKHTKSGHAMTNDELASSVADVILTEDEKTIASLKEKYDLFSVPKNIRQFEKETEPENSLDKFFYKYSHKLPISKNDHFKMLIWKFGNNYNEIKEILHEHGARETK